MPPSKTDHWELAKSVTYFHYMPRTQCTDNNILKKILVVQKSNS